MSLHALPLSARATAALEALSEDPSRWGVEEHHAVRQAMGIPATELPGRLRDKIADLLSEGLAARMHEYELVAGLVSSRDRVRFATNAGDITETLTDIGCREIWRHWATPGGDLVRLDGVSTTASELFRQELRKIPAVGTHSDRKHYHDIFVSLISGDTCVQLDHPEPQRRPSMVGTLLRQIETERRVAQLVDESATALQHGDLQAFVKISQEAAATAQAAEADAVNLHHEDIGADASVNRTRWFLPIAPSMSGGNLYVIAGATGGKKTFFAQNQMEMVTRGDIVYGSVEMTAAEMATRQACLQMPRGTKVPWLSMVSEPDEQHTADDQTYMLDGQRLEDLRNAYRQRWGQKGGQRIRFVGPRHGARVPVLTVDMIAAEVSARAAQGRHIGLVVVDYVQEMSAGPRVRRGKDTIDAVLRQLKELAVAHDVPVMVLAQLNRAAKEVDRPGEEHLSGSALIANIATAIWIHWDTGEPVAGWVPMAGYQPKNRKGRKANLRLQFCTRTGRMEMPPKA